MVLASRGEDMVKQLTASWEANILIFVNILILGGNHEEHSDSQWG